MSSRLSSSRTKSKAPKKTAKKSHPRLKRTLSRRAFSRVLQVEDLKWIWAAYRMKGLDNRLFPEGLDQDAFRRHFFQLLNSLQEVYVLLADNPQKGEIVPVGMIGVVETPLRLEPHAEWFPWATDRNKIECVVSFVNSLRREKIMFIFSKEKDHKFFTHVAKYGILRRVGKIPNYYPNGDDAMLFVSVNNERSV